MEKIQFKKLQKQIKIIIDKLETEATEEGIDITSEKWIEFIRLLKEELLKRVGLTLGEYDELVKAYKEKKEERFADMLETFKAPTIDEIKQTAEEITSKAISEFKPEIPAPQIINKIVKEVIKEKPQIIETREIIKELDKEKLNKLLADLTKLQESFIDLYSKVEKFEIPDLIKKENKKWEKTYEDKLDFIRQAMGRTVGGLYNDIQSLRGHIHSTYIIGDGVSKVTVGTVEPTSPTEGDLWVDTT